ncbi:hypothetical protein D5S17_09820 [Pseudonocardiaceae bacterium YIM PH 21723]|nr:hypothetical protein D5S17_09820 [Pseudonocardiaceae bacterium YIM PH 21723]
MTETQQRSRGRHRTTPPAKNTLPKAVLGMVAAGAIMGVTAPEAEAITHSTVPVPVTAQTPDLMAAPEPSAESSQAEAVNLVLDPAAGKAVGERLGGFGAGSVGAIGATAANALAKTGLDPAAVQEAGGVIGKGLGAPVGKLVGGLVTTLTNKAIQQGANSAQQNDNAPEESAPETAPEEAPVSPTVNKATPKSNNLKGSAPVSIDSATATALPIFEQLLQESLQQATGGGLDALLPGDGSFPGGNLPSGGFPGNFPGGSGLPIGGGFTDGVDALLPGAGFDDLAGLAGGAGWFEDAAGAAGGLETLQTLGELGALGALGL